MIYIWASQYGNWIIRPRTDQAGWELRWYDLAGQPEQVRLFIDPAEAAQCVARQATGFQFWDMLIRVPRDISNLSSWSQVAEFP